MESPKIFWAVFILIAGGFFILGRATKSPVIVREPAAQEETCPPAPEAVACPAVAPAPVAAAPVPQPAPAAAAPKPVAQPPPAEALAANKEFEGEWEYSDRTDTLRLRIDSETEGLSGGYMLRLPSVTNPSSGDFTPADSSSAGSDKIVVLDDMVRVRLSSPGPTSLSGTIEVMNENRGTWDSYRNVVFNKIERRARF